MIVPGRRTIFFAAVLAVILVAAVLDPLVAMAVLFADLALLSICYLEGRLLRRTAVDVAADSARRVQVDREENFSFRVTNRSDRTIIVQVCQPWPVEIRSNESHFEVRMAPHEIVDVALRATPRVRGGITIPPHQVEIRTSADWARRRWTVSGARSLKVFPSLRGMTEYEALRRQRASGYSGVHRQRMLGAGHEFDQLREYGADDDFRDINWKATARRNHPITNMYQAERSRDVLLCLDCGRMMGNPVGDRTALDHAIDAAILLAHVANRQGDRVGLALFRDTVHRFVKPAAGMTAANHIIEELVDTRPKPVFPSYSALITSLRTYQNRRSLVLIFTDLNDPQLAANLAEVLPLASRRHVPVIISLRDPLLDQIASGPANDRRDVFEVLAASQLAKERATRTLQLQQRGASVLEADAGLLTIKLLNTYLSIKARQLI